MPYTANTRSRGFAIGWDYAIQWLTILPYEITAAGLTIDYWHTYNIGIWIAVFLVILTAIQFFGVRGYGEVEFVLSTLKSLACIGFIIFAIVVDCGGIPGNDGKLGQSYIGAKFWHNPGAFANGFKGFCTVFVTASFAYGGTELTGLAAAEAADPVRQIPKATKQVFWRIAFFYVVNLFLLGLIVPYNSPRLLANGGPSTKYSPFVIAITETGVRGLPSVFNAVITISVISVANSATYASTRTIQALATQGMAPKFLAYVDKKGSTRPHCRSSAPARAPRFRQRGQGWWRQDTIQLAPRAFRYCQLLRVRQHLRLTHPLPPGMEIQRSHPCGASLQSRLWRLG